jgi:Flp pilus assembly protein TadG
MKPQKTLLAATSRSRRHGATAVELAVALIPLTTIVMGILESGRLMSAQEVMVNAAREGARLAVLGGSVMGSSSTTGSNEVNYRVRQYLDGGSVPSSTATITISDLDIPGITDLPQASPGDRIQVQVSIPFNRIAWCTPWFFGDATLLANSIMRKEAP